MDACEQWLPRSMFTVDIASRSQWMLLTLLVLCLPFNNVKQELQHRPSTKKNIPLNKKTRRSSLDGPGQTPEPARVDPSREKNKQADYSS